MLLTAETVVEVAVPLYPKIVLRKLSGSLALAAVTPSGVISRVTSRPLTATQQTNTGVESLHKDQINMSACEARTIVQPSASARLLVVEKMPKSGCTPKHCTEYANQSLGVH